MVTCANTRDGPNSLSRTEARLSNSLSYLAMRLGHDLRTSEYRTRLSRHYLYIPPSSSLLDEYETVEKSSSSSPLEMLSSSCSRERGIGGGRDFLSRVIRTVKSRGPYNLRKSSIPISLRDILLPFRIRLRTCAAFHPRMQRPQVLCCSTSMWRRPRRCVSVWYTKLRQVQIGVDNPTTLQMV